MHISQYVCVADLINGVLTGSTCDVQTLHNIHVYTCTNTHMHTHSQIHMYICAHIKVHTNKHTYTHVCTHTDTRYAVVVQN